MSDKVGGISMDEIMAAAMDGIDDQDSDALLDKPVVTADVEQVDNEQNVQQQSAEQLSNDNKNPEKWDVPIIGAARRDAFANQPQAGIGNLGGPAIIGGGAPAAGAAPQVVEKQAEEPNNNAQPEVKPAVVMPEPTIQQREFQCKRCGNPLKIPRNSKGIVVCSFCKTETVIDGLVKNSEIADKENINSGISINADSSVLHNIVVEALSNSKYIPLDVFQKATVIREERYCVPAYLYYCNGTTSYSYEAGNIREHKTAIDLGDKTRVEKEQYVEWTQMTGMASASATLIAPGNKEFAKVITDLYLDYSPNELIDVEELEFPYDVETYSYNLPQSAAFNEYVRPEMEGLLLQKAEESLQGRRYRNLSAGGGSNIQKDEIIRLFLGLYRIVYQYEGQEYYIYVTGDGKHYTYDQTPVDEQRVNQYRALQDKRNSVDEKRGMNTLIIVGIVVCAIAAIFTFGITLLPAAGLGYLLYKNKKAYSDNVSAVDAEISALDDQRRQALQEFNNNQQTLQGLYSIN